MELAAIRRRRQQLELHQRTQHLSPFSHASASLFLIPLRAASVCRRWNWTHSRNCEDETDSERTTTPEPPQMFNARAVQSMCINLPHMIQKIVTIGALNCVCVCVCVGEFIRWLIRGRNWEDKSNWIETNEIELQREISIGNLFSIFSRRASPRTTDLCYPRIRVTGDSWRCHWLKSR